MSGAQFEEVPNLGGIPSLGELRTFFRSLLEGGDARLMASWNLKKEMGLRLWGLL